MMPRIVVACLLLLGPPVPVVAYQNSSHGTGIVDFIREAVWGQGKDGGLYGHISTPRSSAGHGAAKDRGPSAGSLLSAQRLVASLEIKSDGRTKRPGGRPEYCMIGACCGWGHRLLREAKTFTHIHYLQNRTTVLEW